MRPKDAEGIANSVDPDQTALGAVWSGSALFAQAYLSKNLGSLQYYFCWAHWHSQLRIWLPFRRSWVHASAWPHYLEIGHEVISIAVLSLQLIHVGQLSGTGKNLCI